MHNITGYMERTQPRSIEPPEIDKLASGGESREMLQQTLFQCYWSAKTPENNAHKCIQTHSHCGISTIVRTSRCALGTVLEQNYSNAKTHMYSLYFAHNCSATIREHSNTHTQRVCARWAAHRIEELTHIATEHECGRETRRLTSNYRESLRNRIGNSHFQCVYSTEPEIGQVEKE